MSVDSASVVFELLNFEYSQLNKLIKVEIHAFLRYPLYYVGTKAFIESTDSLSLSCPLYYVNHSIVFLAFEAI